jgi:glycosyltransferase involved in cell wall biosynthesis
MIQVLNYLKSKNEIFELICFGEINRRLSRLLSEIPGYENIKNQVVFKGFIPVEEAMKFSADCLAGIAIYDDLPNHRNSMPTKIFEYMSVGLPVITSNFPDYIEIILKNKCGFCLQPDDIENIATTIIDLYNNPDLAHNMAINGINSVKECYNWTSEELKLVDIYQNLLA